MKFRESLGLITKAYMSQIGKCKRNGYFLDKHHIPKSNQDQVNNLNRPSHEEIEAVCHQKPPNQKKLRARWF